jgi:predicted transposase YdaD
LNELEDRETAPLGIQIIQLVVAKKKHFLEKVSQLIHQVKDQFTDKSYQLQMLNLLETLVLVKLPQISRKEL